MSIRNIIPAFFYLSLFLACTSKNTELKEEVIAIHDEVMPHMGKLQSLQKELTEKADLLALEDSVGQREQILDLRNTAADLGLAYEGMFVWMRQFEPDQGELTEEEYEAYLNDQKILVKKVNQDINRALEKAEELDR